MAQTGELKISAAVKVHGSIIADSCRARSCVWGGREKDLGPLTERSCGLGFWKIQISEPRNHTIMWLA